MGKSEEIETSKQSRTTENNTRTTSSESEQIDRIKLNHNKWGQIRTTKNQSEQELDQERDERKSKQQFSHQNK